MNIRLKYEEEIFTCQANKSTLKTGSRTEFEDTISLNYLLLTCPVGGGDVYIIITKQLLFGNKMTNT